MIVPNPYYVYTGQLNNGAFTENERHRTFNEGVSAGQIKLLEYLIAKCQITYHEQGWLPPVVTRQDLQSLLTVIKEQGK